MLQVSRKDRVVWFALVSAIAILPGAAGATELLVPSQYATIAEAVAGCDPGDVIKVADPTEPIGAPVWSADGFRDIEIDIAITIKSASDNPATCVIDCDGAGRTFLFTGQAASGSVLRGFTIKNGFVADEGGAILCQNGASPSILNCVFENNYSHSGGAVACLAGSSPHATAPMISYCEFRSNGSDSTECGGALYAYDSRPIVTHCEFIGNQAYNSGGAIYAFRGTLMMTHCEIWGNMNHQLIWGWEGGGVYLYNTTGSLLRNCLIAQNGLTKMSSLKGAGVRIDEGEVLFENCTIAHNLTGSTDRGGGLDVTPAGAATIARCIVWGNSGIQIDANAGAPGDIAASYCDVQGGYGNGQDPTMLDVDPGFLSLAAVGDYFLTQTTACIDGGGLDSGGVGLRSYTTNTDLSQDADIVDLGWHYPRNCDAYDPYYPDSWKTGIGREDDCNHNGVPDVCDIAEGTSLDVDPADGTPDECQGCPTPARYAGEADPLTETFSFDVGTLINVQNTGETGLQRYEYATPLPFINVALSSTSRGTLIRVLTQEWPERFPGVPEGTILGEYRTAPGNTGSSPSRTATDLDGSCWVANRSDNVVSGTGSVAKIGLLIGGQRCNVLGVADANGEYVRSTDDHPIIYNSGCVDRNGDGLLRTSRGLGYALGWTSPATPGTVDWAEDECICSYRRVAASNTRHVSIDRENNLWVGSQLDRQFELIDSVDGTVLDDFSVGVGGYGGLSAFYKDELGDTHRVIWSTNAADNLLRYDLDAPADWTKPAPYSYGITMDRLGNIWVGEYGRNKVKKFTPAGGVAIEEASAGEAPGEGASPKGLAVTSADNHLWITKSSSNVVVRLDENGSFIKTVSLPDPDIPGDTGSTPTAVAVDSAGKVWVTCQGGNTIKRIDPEDDDGTVDLTVPVLNGAPYNFGNMTGDVTLRATGIGTWDVIHDSGKFNALWSYVKTNTESCANPFIPEGTSLEVEVRASDFLTELSGLPFTPAGCGERTYGVSGRYLEIRVRLKGTYPGETFQTPVLCDLSVHSLLADLNCDGLLNSFDIDPFVLALTNPEEYAEAFPCCPRELADVNCDGLVNAFDVDPFVRMLTSGDGCTCGG